MELATIAALATAPYPAGIAVVRVSGKGAKNAIKAIFKSKISPIENPRLMVLGSIVDFNSGSIIDKGLAVYMPAPNSYTGEDVVEFQFHGSMLLAERVLSSLFASGISPAEPGEFTKRAFLNGKLDLVQAEAICDLINATSEKAVEIAGLQLEGKLSVALEEVAEPLRNILAELEANIDFPEEDINPHTLDEIKKKVSDIIASINSLLSSYRYGSKVKDGYRVLLAGPPNAGKSSLLNALVGKKKSIVTDIAGTTRDLIEEETIFSGYYFIFCDSAGIVETTDPVEKIGVELAWQKVEWADLVLFVVNGEEIDKDWNEVTERISKKAKNLWMIINKIDLNQSAIGKIICPSNVCARNFYLSAKTQEGLNSLKEALVEEVRNLSVLTSETSLVVTNARQRNDLEKGRDALIEFMRGIDNNLPLEVLSAELRRALIALEQIIGKTYNEDILDRIFSKFCIGK